MQLMQTCLYTGNTLQRRFNRQGGAVKRVQACSNASKDGETVFTIEVLCSWYKPVYVRETAYNSVFTGAVKHVQA